MVSQDGLFGRASAFPDPDAQDRLAALVGVDHITRQLIAEASLLLDPSPLLDWSKKHYPSSVIRAVDEVTRRTPLIVFAGDVGTGKTELAETFPDAVARTMRIALTLYPLSLSARGKGAVGEMTTLLTQAFAHVRDAALKGRDSKGRVRHGVILLVDEGDALAQSRDLAQMHHEDRAGVNALIRGIDQLRNEQLPVLTVLCTNREDALDPAIVRRAAQVFRFERPDDEQRRVLLQSLLDGASLSSATLEKLVSITGGGKGAPYGCTQSDIRQRLIPQAVLDAVSRDAPLDGKRLIELAEDFEPTRPFGASR